MSKTLDLRGFSCPIPLLQTKKAMEAADVLTVIIDEPAAKENIIKFANSQQYKVEASKDGGDYKLVIRK